MIYLTGDHLPIKTIRQMGKKLKAPLWPSNDKPLIKYGLEQSFPKKLAVLAKDLDEDKLSELFFLPVSSSPIKYETYIGSIGSRHGDIKLANPSKNVSKYSIITLMCFRGQR